MGVIEKCCRKLGGVVDVEMAPTIIDETQLNSIPTTKTMSSRQNRFHELGMRSSLQSFARLQNSVQRQLGQ